MYKIILRDDNAIDLFRSYTYMQAGFKNPLLAHFNDYKIYLYIRKHIS